MVRPATRGKHKPKKMKEQENQKMANQPMEVDKVSQEGQGVSNETKKKDSRLINNFRFLSKPTDTSMSKPTETNRMPTVEQDRVGSEDLREERTGKKSKKILDNSGEGGNGGATRSLEQHKIDNDSGGERRQRRCYKERKQVIEWQWQWGEGGK